MPNRSIVKILAAFVLVYFVFYKSEENRRPGSDYLAGSADDQQDWPSSIGVNIQNQGWPADRRGHERTETWYWFASAIISLLSLAAVAAAAYFAWGAYCAAKEQAKQAKRQADAAVAQLTSNRAMLLLSVDRMPPESDVSNGVARDRIKFKIKYFVHNMGDTAAVVECVNSFLFFEREQPLQPWESMKILAHYPSLFSMREKVFPALVDSVNGPKWIDGKATSPIVLPARTNDVQITQDFTIINYPGITPAENEPPVGRKLFFYSSFRYKTIYGSRFSSVYTAFGIEGAPEAEKYNYYDLREAELPSGAEPSSCPGFDEFSALHRTPG